MRTQADTTRSKRLRLFGRWALTVLTISVSAMFMPGCVYRHTQFVAMTGSSAAPEWGKIKVFATAVVPFEFEELGFVQMHYESNDPGGPPDDKAMTAKFVDKVREMGADAVLNFRCERVGPYWNFSVSGVAVKIKRP